MHSTKPQDASKKKRVLEAPDDPHRLARLFVASRFRTQHGNLTLVFWKGDLHAWQNNAWRPVSAPELKAQLTQFVKREFDRLNLAAQRKCGDEEPPPKCQKVTRTLVENVLQAVQSLVVIPSSIDQPAWLDGAHEEQPTDLIATQSGLLHLPTAGTGSDCLLPATPRFFSPTALDYEYDPSAGCPNWLEFLSTLWPDDKASVETLQEFAGYLLTPQTHLHKLLMLIGPPRSGKGTIGRTLRAMLGAANVAAPTLSSLAEQFGLAPLVGKRLALVADARLSGRADAVAVVERLLSITGEDPQDVQRKHLPTLAGIRLPVKFLILANELPNLRDTAGALLSRTVLLRLTRSFVGREDRGLEPRLMGELPGILNWAIEGLRRLKARGEFVQPASASELLADLEDLASPVNQFVRECCIVGPEWSVAVHDLFAAWKAWCEQHGREHPGTQQTFGRDLRAALPALACKRFGSDGSRERAYLGIALNPALRPHTSADILFARVAETDLPLSRERNENDRGRTRTYPDFDPSEEEEFEL